MSATLSLPMLKHCFPGPRVRDSGGMRTRTPSGRVVPVSGLAGAGGPAAPPASGRCASRAAAGSDGPAGRDGAAALAAPPGPRASCGGTTARVPAGPPLLLRTQALGTEQWGRALFLLTQQCSENTVRIWVSGDG